MDSEAKRLGRVIRQARQQQGRSQEAVARALGYHQSKISRLEQGIGTSNANTLREVATILAIPLDQLGLRNAPAPPAGGTPGPAEWREDVLVSLARLTDDIPALRRSGPSPTPPPFLPSEALPPPIWWDRAARRGTTRSTPPGRVGAADVAAVQDTTAMFSAADQRHGGGHARSALAMYLGLDVAPYLEGHFTSDTTRRAMFSAAGEAAYLAGWTAFDDFAHHEAARWFRIAIKLAAEADNPPLAGHVMRAMAHQANDLGHPRQALQLAAASITGRRYHEACPRERALLDVVHARTLASTGQPAAAAKALLRAEDALHHAQDQSDEEAARVWFFTPAALAHETALTLRDLADPINAIQQLQRSVRLRGPQFQRTRAVTLGYLGQIHARQGDLEQATARWTEALDIMNAGVRSGRTRQAAQDMRTSLAPHRARAGTLVQHIDERAAAYLHDTQPPTSSPGAP